MPQEHRPLASEAQPETIDTAEFSPEELVSIVGHALERVRKEVRKDEYDRAA